MLLERNENKRTAGIPVTKPQITAKHTKKLQKENNTLLNHQYTSLNIQKQHIEPVVEDPKKNLLVVETNKIKSTNLKKILVHELSKTKGNYRPDILQRHKISADIRTRMVK